MADNQLYILGGISDWICVLQQGCLLVTYDTSDSELSWKHVSHSLLHNCSLKKS